MEASSETAALVALLNSGRRDGQTYANEVDEAGVAHPLLEEEQGLLTAQLIEAAADQVDRWRRAGMRAVTILDPDYPENLRAVHDRPPLVFVRGDLTPADTRAVALIGSREASPGGLALAWRLATYLVEAGFTVISGLARGIDTAAHQAALDRGGRTVAVVGNGLEHCYPPENAQLQREIAARGAVVSQFWPDAAPARRNFPMRNALMSGLALATLIVEAGPTSGARTQARLALGHGRPVLLMESLLEQEWAQMLARRPGAHVIASADEAAPLVEHLSSSDIAA